MSYPASNSDHQPRVPPLHPQPVPFTSSPPQAYYCPPNSPFPKSDIYSGTSPPFHNPSYYSPRHQKHIQIRRVWWHNFAHEMTNIKYMIHYTPYNVVSMDTEFPGVIYSSEKFEDRHPAAQYSLMKKNVDELNLIQVGLTLSSDGGSAGNLATTTTLHSGSFIYVWEFAICDFDINKDPYNLQSINILKSRGLDLVTHRQYGIPSHEFSKMLLDTGLVLGPKDIHWITFHGAYDFGYLIKGLTKKKLPESLDEFLDLVKHYFGKYVYDVKFLLRFQNNLFGGLEALADQIGESRSLGEGHQAGSDSLLTLMVLQKLKQMYLYDEAMFKQVAGHIHPLAN